MTPWTVAYQAPPSMGFSRQEYSSGLPFPSPGDLPNPGINMTSYPVLFPLCNFTKTVLGKKIKHIDLKDCAILCFVKVNFKFNQQTLNGNRT